MTSFASGNDGDDGGVFWPAARLRRKVKRPRGRDIHSKKDAPESLGGRSWNRAVRTLDGWRIPGVTLKLTEPGTSLPST